MHYLSCTIEVIMKHMGKICQYQTTTKHKIQSENHEQCDGLESLYVVQSMGIAYMHVDYIHTADTLQNTI